MRAFIAIDLGDAEKRELAHVIERGRTESPDSRWVRLDQLHVTLVFLGNIDDEAVVDVEARMNQVAARHTGLRLALGHPGTFGGAARPNVLYATVNGHLDALAALRHDLAAELEHLVPEEPRVFTPHITLARARERRGDATLAAARERLPTPRADAFTVSEIVLYRSEIRSTGTIHTRVVGVPLAREA